jgi:hypothetical protein
MLITSVHLSSSETLWIEQSLFIDLQFQRIYFDYTQQKTAVGFSALSAPKSLACLILSFCGCYSKKKTGTQKRHKPTNSQKAIFPFCSPRSFFLLEPQGRQARTHHQH